jgi:hypothetical protein
MTAPIGLGDSVYVWKWHACGCGLGRVGVVTRMGFTLNTTGCTCCRTPVTGKDAIDGLSLDGKFNAPIEWVKRIPPIGELEGQPSQEDIKTKDPV